MSEAIATQEEVNGYYRDVERLLSCAPDQRRRLMKTLRQGVEDYRTFHPSADIDDIIFHFGTPDQIARGFHFSGHPERKHRHLKISKKYGWSMILIILALLVLFGTLAAHRMRQQNPYTGKGYTYHNETFPG